MKTRFTYKGPIALYISYYVLFVLSLSLVALTFRVDSQSILFVQLLITGVGAALISLSLILYYTQVERKIIPHQWREEANTYYNDEGIFEYTPDGFAVVARDGKSLKLRWEDIVRADSGESKLSEHIKKFHINLFLSERDFITVDSTMAGFSVFEKRLKQNLRDLLKKETVQQEEETDSTGRAAAKIS